MTEDGGGGGGGREQSPMISCCRLMSIPDASVLLGDGASHTWSPCGGLVGTAAVWW